MCSKFIELTETKIIGGNSRDGKSVENSTDENFRPK